MSNIFKFIAVKKINNELLLHAMIEALNKSDNLNKNLYISILPPLEGLYLVEFSDFIPVTRYRDIDIIEYVNYVARNFNVVYLFDKNAQMKKSRYQKYLKGKLETEYKGENAFEKGLKFDLLLDFDYFAAHVQKIWAKKYSDQDERPVVYQIVKDNKILDDPIKLSYTEFYD